MDTTALLGSLSSLSVRTAAAEKKILAAARERDDQLAKDLEQIRGRALLEEDAAAKYQELVLERGRLARVIALARHNGATSDA